MNNPAPISRIKFDLPIGNSSDVFGQDAGQMIEMRERRLQRSADRGAAAGRLIDEAYGLIVAAR